MLQSSKEQKGQGNVRQTIDVKEQQLTDNFDASIDRMHSRVEEQKLDVSADEMDNNHSSQTQLLKGRNQDSMTFKTVKAQKSDLKSSLKDLTSAKEETKKSGMSGIAKLKANISD